MRDRKIFALLLILAVPAVSGAPSFEIRESCQGDEENLFSMYSKKGGNIAEPGYYRWQVCGEEVTSSAVRKTCRSGENMVMSMYARQDSHASSFSTYRYKVCADGLQTSVSQTCNGDPIASLAKRDDTHVAEPGHFDLQLCPSFQPAENVTLQLRLDASSVYVSGSPAQEKTYNPLELEYPYIVSDQPAGIVSYGSLVSLEYEQGSRDVFRVTQDSGSFLLPHTTGGQEEIEDHQQEVVNRQFLDQLAPSFHYTIPENPVVKVFLNMDKPTRGFETIETGSIEIAVRNTLDNETLIEFRPR